MPLQWDSLRGELIKKGHFATERPIGFFFFFKVKNLEQKGGRVASFNLERGMVGQFTVDLGIDGIYKGIPGSPRVTSIHLATG